PEGRAQTSALRAVPARRELAAERPARVAERRGASAAPRDLRRAVDEQLVVRDLARELEAEPEVSRDLIAPPLDDVGRGERVERRVALDGVEHLGVALEELGRPRRGREQPADPGLHAPAGTAEVVAADRHTGVCRAKSEVSQATAVSHIRSECWGRDCASLESFVGADRAKEARREGGPARRANAPRSLYGRRSKGS